MFRGNPAVENSIEYGFRDAARSVFRRIPAAPKNRPHIARSPRGHGRICRRTRTILFVITGIPGTGKTTPLWQQRLGTSPKGSASSLGYRHTFSAVLTLEGLNYVDWPHRT